jgi:CubicO group peptidase (beta-lactamase class C family)
MKRVLTLVLAAFVLQFVHVTQAISQSKSDEISDLLSLYRRYDKFNGSALVSEGGEVIHKGGNGWANMEWKIQNSADTKHRLGSITKQFTAMLIMQLMEEGKLKLDVPVTT